MRVLIIEDESELTRLLRQSLTESGFSVDTAADGEEGLNKALHTDYDAVLLDLMLPRMSGSEVLTKRSFRR